MISKPSVAKNVITVIADNTISESAREIVGIHYVNTTAGAGLVRVYDPNDATKAIYLSSDAANGNDSFTPCQPMPFNKIAVDFVTGTGFVSLVTN